MPPAASSNPTFYADIANPQSLNKYAYCYNSPLLHIDPDGHAVDTILDVIGIGYDIYDLATAPSWGKAGLLVADIGLAAIPFVPSPGAIKLGAKAGNRAVRLLGPAGDAAARGLTRMERFRELTKGFTVGNSKFTLGEHVLNSLRKSGRGDIDPDSLIRALQTKAQPGQPGSRVFTDPKTGTRFFVNEQNVVVGVHPKSFK